MIRDGSTVGIPTSSATRAFRRKDSVSPGSWDGYQFGSAHPAGIMAMMADGSVRMLAFTVDPTVFNNLGNREDGQSVKLD